MVVADPDALEGLGFEKAGHRTESPDFYAEHMAEAGFRDCCMDELDIPTPATLILGRAPGDAKPAGSDGTSSSARAEPAASTN